MSTGLSKLIAPLERKKTRVVAACSVEFHVVLCSSRMAKETVCE